MKIDALDIKEVGKIEELKQGIVKISGLFNCSYGEVIELESGLRGMIIEFNPSGAYGIVFGDD